MRTSGRKIMNGIDREKVIQEMADDREDENTEDQTALQIEDDNWFLYGLNHLDQFPELQDFIEDDDTESIPCPTGAESSGNAL